MSLKVKVDPLDTLFSLYIRMRAKWKCERCGSRPDKRGLHTHHFIRRRFRAVRYDPDNGIALCLGCHQYFDENREEEKAFMVNKLGQKAIDMLRNRMRQGKPDRKAVKLYLREEIRKLEREYD